MHWASKYIGLPWSATGEGPGSFHCWSFVRHVMAEHFGRDVPAIPYTEDLLDLARSFRDHAERRRWHEIELADVMPGDAVLLRQARYPIHIGVWIEARGGGVLHCSRDSGVVHQRLADLRLNGWHIAGIYRFHGDRDGGENG